MTAMRLKRFGWNTATTLRQPSPLRARRGQNRADLARQVGVVVDQRCATVDTADVEAAGDTTELGQGARRDVEVDADGECHGQRPEGIAHVVDAAQRQVDAYRASHPRG